MLVYVISEEGLPLMPCTSVIARLLLKQGKAKVKRREPFTIKLLYKTTEYVQECTLGVDTGSGTLGTAVVDGENNVLYMSEVILRNDITRNMEQRASYRRNRRNRKTRYRKARFMNRKNSIKSDRFSPTMKSKFDSHIKEIEFVKSILPIRNLVLETATFDTHLLKNPALNNPKYRIWGYQKGENYGFENTKAKVLNRDNYTCQHCKNKKSGTRLEVHHIVYHSQGGSDKEDNLITLCDSCHKKVHSGAIKLKLNGKKKGRLKYATQMNSIRIQVSKRYPKAIETFGYVTKYNRQNSGLPKEHYIDSCVIASEGNKVSFKTDIVNMKRCINDGDFQKTKGVRSEQPINTGKICGFKKFDKVKYMNGEYFIKGRMSTGYAVLMDIEGNKADFSHMPKGFKTVKLNNCRRVNARKSWITTQKIIQNIA